MSNKSNFGTEELGKLLRKQAIPASIGILVMSIYGIVDTIFIGRWVGSNGIGAVTVVMPITYLISSIGMAIGIGGSSIISRALGEENPKKAIKTFGNQIVLTFSLATLVVILGFQYCEFVIDLFGGKGEVFEPAVTYFKISLFGIPFLAWAMMSNTVIRALGYPKMAMYVLIVPAIVNLILDPILIAYFDMGISGAAWATTIAYFMSAIYTLWFFIFRQKQMKLTGASLMLSSEIIKEITSLGSVTLARQGTIAALSILLNNALFTYGAEAGLSAYGIIGRVMMFANFPVLGVTQGFIPVVGFNFGAKLFNRVENLIRISIKAATFIALGIFVCIMAFTPYIVRIFTTEQELIEVTVTAIRIAFLATPLIAINLIGSAYYQAIGKAIPALLLTLTKQGFFLIPLILLLPGLFGINGIWAAFPIADAGAALVTFWFLRKGLIDLKKMKEISE